jgi:enterochelin esterase-like enzyme
METVSMKNFGLVLMAAGLAFGQGKGKGGVPPPPPYVVNADNTVTFALRAPQASTVQLAADFLTAPQDMTKGAMLGPPATPSARSAQQFPNDVLNDVLPFVEKLYRISGNADDRAIAGLSMGGAQTLDIGLNHLEMFRYVGAFSSAIFGGDVAKAYAPVFSDPAGANKKLKVSSLYIGDADFLLDANKKFHAELDAKGIQHNFTVSADGHVWRNWRDYLADFAPKLFR